MRVAFYAPFKPLDHPLPSGDLIIARGLVDHLREHGHCVSVVSQLRARNIVCKPWLWPRIPVEIFKAQKLAKAAHADIWMTYHTYYKSPDVIGPLASWMAGVPYIIFQGMYSTKRAKRWKTWFGYQLNRFALLHAFHVFTNKHRDYENLIRLLPEDRVTYIRPGIIPDQFRFDEQSRSRLRKQWGVGNCPVIMAAAMFRKDVKTQGLRYVIARLGELAQSGYDFQLIIAGDGVTRNELELLAAKHLPGKAHFLGLIPRNELSAYYSAADLFVFPGINESLGMVYLEAQASGLPVVAFDNDGLPEVVINKQTGFLTEPFADHDFRHAIAALLDNRRLRLEMGENAEHYVRTEHDLTKNYQRLETMLAAIDDTMIQTRFNKRDAQLETPSSDCVAQPSHDESQYGRRRKALRDDQE
ncbi:glycosyltransferase family 4 protein [Desulfovibrio inopinatus]|uniref:glycosyltransferase family 4 protein n=1 Tax=Desulfovibrio inopinatus TaxID=102109 RepID=UPI00041E207A|nr:glycosyltransferase family 4 protein [Desulfovibrio inopinatus]